MQPLYGILLGPCWLAALMVLAAGQPKAAEGMRPTRVISTNLCADQYVLRLADRDQIAAVSILANDEALSVHASAVAGLKLTKARAEELVRLKPDLVLADSIQGIRASRFLAGLGIRVLIIPEVADFDGIKENLRLVGEALGQRPRAEREITDLEAAMARLPHRAAQRPGALIYEPNGYSPGSGSFSNAVLEAAGLRNLAGDLGIKGYGTVPLEHVVMAAPDIIIFDDHRPSAASRAQGLLHHPAFKRMSAKTRQIWMPSKLWICAGPWTLDAVSLLAPLARKD